MPDSGIDWGILQPLQSQAPIRTATPEANAASNVAPNPGDGSGALSALAQQQQIGIERQKLGLLQHADAREQQLQPGLLQHQQVENAGIGLDNTTKQQQIAANNYAVKVHQDAMQAYADGKNRGGTQGGIDALAESHLKNGDTDSYYKIKDTQEKLQKSIADDDKEGIVGIGSIVHSNLSRETPPTFPSKGPQGQVIPGKPGHTALQDYTDQYATIKKIYPRAPDPSSFKSNQQFHDTFAIPVLATTLPVTQEVAAKAEALKTDATYKANLNVNSTRQALQDAVKTYGTNSQEAKDAAITYQQAKTAADVAANGTNYFTNTLKGAYKSVMPESMGGNPSIDSTIKEEGQPSSDKSIPAPTPSVTKTIDGSTYIQQGGKWYHQ